MTHIDINGFNKELQYMLSYTYPGFQGTFIEAPYMMAYELNIMDTLTNQYKKYQIGYTEMIGMTNKHIIKIVFDILETFPRYRKIELCKNSKLGKILYK